MKEKNELLFLKDKFLKIKLPDVIMRPKPWLGGRTSYSQDIF